MSSVVIMGVSGCGKSTLGRLLATGLDRAFVEGDDFHSPAAIAKMRAGRPLTDADRWPWLDRLGRALSAGDVVASCSALKRAYRDRLAAAAGRPLRFVLLDGEPAMLRRRLAARTGHYMPPSLLESQLATLERPGADEFALLLDFGQPPGALCDAAVAWLQANAAIPSAGGSAS